MIRGVQYLLREFNFHVIFRRHDSCEGECAGDDEAGSSRCVDEGLFEDGGFVGLDGGDFMYVSGHFNFLSEV